MGVREVRDVGRGSVKESRVGEDGKGWGRVGQGRRGKGWNTPLRIADGKVYGSRSNTKLVFCAEGDC